MFGSVVGGTVALQGWDWLSALSWYFGTFFPVCIASGKREGRRRLSSAF
jgi:hypothetical protein